MDYPTLLKDSGVLSSTVAFLLGVGTSWWFYRKSRQDAQESHRILIQFNLKLSEQIASLTSQGLSEESQQKLAEIRKTLKELDEPQRFRMATISISILVFVWFSAGLLMYLFGDREAIFLLLFPGFLPFMILWGWVDNVVQWFYRRDRRKKVSDALSSKNLTYEEVNLLRSWANEHAWLSLSLAWVINEIERYLPVTPEQAD